MTPTTALSEALITLDPARLGEVNLLLQALATGAKAQDVTSKAVLAMAGRSDRIPQPDLYISVALRLGLVQEVQQELQLTTLGRQMTTASPGLPTDRLNDLQANLLAPELLTHPELSDSVMEAMRLMFPTSRSSMKAVVRGAAIGDSAALGLKILQITRLAELQGDCVVISDERLQQLRALLGELTPISDEQFSSIAQEISKRARAAEEYVEEFERRRLTEVGCSDLSKLVTRVSKYDIGAHYDVRSFEKDATPRFIEVKSSVGLQVRFIWSVSERKFAEVNRSAYWIYFVPRAHELPLGQHGIVMISDPVGMSQDTLFIEPADLNVALKQDLNKIPALMMAGTPVRVIV